METSVERVKARKKVTTEANHDEKICENIIITRKTWNQQHTRTQEGKLCRGRPQLSQQKETKDTARVALKLAGDRCDIAKTIRPDAVNSAAQLTSQQHHNAQHITVLKHERDSTGSYIVPRSDEILFELHKILVFREEDPFINAVCAKRRSKPKVDEKKNSRQRRADKKNGYFNRKTTMTVGERALNEGRAANSSKWSANKRENNSLQSN